MSTPHRPCPVLTVREVKGLARMCATPTLRARPSRTSASHASLPHRSGTCATEADCLTVRLFAQVLFLAVREDEGLERVRAVAAAAREALEDAGLLGAGGGAFTPHVTVAKLSKMPWRSHMKRIPADAYAPCANISGGSVLLPAVQLCRMGVRWRRACSVRTFTAASERSGSSPM